MQAPMTLQRFVYEQGRAIQGSTGELSDLLLTLSVGVKHLRSLVMTAGFRSVGYAGTTNVHGEIQHELDTEADQLFSQALESTGHFGLLLSEEKEQVFPTAADKEGAKYVVAFDPLDGSSNLGSNIPVGTIFAVFRKRMPGVAASEADFLQSGRSLVAAGYAVYGAKTNFVYSCGQGVHGFTYDPTLGEFLLTEPRIETPRRGKVYSYNEGNLVWADESMKRYLSAIHREDKGRGLPLSLRYVGSLVADVDRNLRKGGIFLYPGDTRSPSGKLRLLYECIPLAFIAEQAGGVATDGTNPILDLVPSSVHQRSPLIIGSRDDVGEFLAAAHATN